MRHFAVKMKLTQHGKSTIYFNTIFFKKRAKKPWEIGHRRRRQVDTEAKQILKMVEGTMKQGMQPKSLWHFVIAAKGSKYSTLNIMKVCFSWKLSYTYNLIESIP